MENLLSKIKNLLYAKRHEMKDRFNRVLPVGELLSDRWEKAKYLGFGDGTSIYDSAMVLGDVTVGKNTWIGPHVILDGSGKLDIGNNCSISAGVQIYTHNTVLWAVSGGKNSYEYSTVKIEDNCFIGPQSIISSGITIGKQSIIGANSFVNKSVERNTIFAGSPAKKIGEVILDNGEVKINYY